jgi:hypothetical protein
MELVIYYDNPIEYPSLRIPNWEHKFVQRGDDVDVGGWMYAESNLFVSCC